jgi:RAP1 GTPase activating protein 1
MARKEHVHLLGQDETTGPVVISYETHAEKYVRALVRTRLGEERIMLQARDKAKRNLAAAYPSFPKLTFVEKNPRLVNDLLNYEKHLVATQFKFGLLYWKTGQLDEDAMYGNTETSPGFERLVSLLGERIALVGWGGFRGGLRVNDASTGTHSVYRRLEVPAGGLRIPVEIMWHIAPLIPATADPQQLERKRHLGNDLLVLIYRDADNTTPFAPAMMRSHVNQVYLILQEVAGGAAYQVAVVARPGIQAFGPPLPADGLLAAEDIPDWLVLKCLNGERAAMAGPDFAAKMTTSRQKLLSSIVSSHAKA